MNILYIILLMLSERWSAIGILSAMLSLLMPSVLLQAAPSVFAGFGDILKAIGILSSLGGVFITVLSCYRAWLNLKRDKMNFQRELEDFEFWKQEILNHKKKQDA